MEPEELAASIKALNAWAQARAPHPEAEPTRRLREHFAADPAKLPIVTRGLKMWERPNLQVAIDAFLADRVSDLLGLVIHRFQPVGLADLARGGQMVAMVGVSEAEHVTIPLGDGEGVACVQSGLWLVDGHDERLALMLKSVDHGIGEQLALQVMAEDRDRAEAVVAELWALMTERNVYRGRVLEMKGKCNPDESPLVVRSLPSISREQIVLAPGVLERIERTTFGVAKHAERLRASGRHLRHGLLMHGPPGVGKTLTAMYLATQMPDRTVVLLTGRGLGTITSSVELAVALAPAIVILEDVDLVAMERTEEPMNALLFELLNAMDGLDADHDVLFILTTNAPERLEPALASRPGRVDQAVELALPDADGRRRLLALYGAGVQLSLDGDESLVAELDGTSPAFIRELVRRSALIAAEQSDNGALRVTADHVREALAELQAAANDLTRSLLGGAAN
jgi:hypothetical protein